MPPLLFAVTSLVKRSNAPNFSKTKDVHMTVNLTVQRAVVEDRLLKAIREDLSSDEYFKWFYSEMRRIRRERRETAGRDRAAREARLTKLWAEVASLVDAITI
jgi:hypothetical protein